MSLHPLFATILDNFCQPRTMSSTKKFTFDYPIMIRDTKGKYLPFDCLSIEAVASINRHDEVRCVDINTITDSEGNEIKKWIGRLDKDLLSEIQEAATAHAENLVGWGKVEIER